jgi:hypothetical protein
VDPGPISIILLSPIYFTRTVYFTRILLLFSTRYAHNLYFKQTGEIDNLIASWKQSIWLCCVQVPRCFCRTVCSSPDRHNLGFLTKGKLAAIFITPSSWGSQRAGHQLRISVPPSGENQGVDRVGAAG